MNRLLLTLCAMSLMVLSCTENDMNDLSNDNVFKPMGSLLPGQHQAYVMVGKYQGIYCELTDDLDRKWLLNTYIINGQLPEGRSLLTYELYDGHIDGYDVLANLNGIDDEIGTAKGGAAVADSQVRGDFRLVAIDVGIQIAQHPVGLVQAVGVNVVQRIFGIFQAVSQEAIAKDVLGKDSASRTHKCDFGHLFFLRKWTCRELIAKESRNAPRNF